jgi:hypothetical protein
MASAYGRRLDYRVAVAPGVAPASGPPDDDAPPPDAPPPGMADGVSESRPGAAIAAANPVRPVAAAPGHGLAKRKRPDDLSPGAKSAMVWLEGEIVGPDRPTP